MFCGECGAKNNQGDRFCIECGSPLVQEEIQVNNTTNVVKKPRQPMSKKNKIIIAVVAAIVVVLGAGYKVGSDMTSPKVIAKDYIEATINQDADKLYKYLEFEGDTTFVSKKIFKELMENNSGKSTEIENYKITGVEYGEGKLTAQVNFTYTLKGSSTERTDSVDLIKQKDKKFILFDNWKIADLSVDEATMKDYKIKVNKGSQVTYAGVKLTDKYLDKNDSTSKLDVYKLPLVFTTKTTIKAVLSNGMEIEETVTPSSYYSTHTVSFDEDSLSEASKEKILAKAKESLTSIYTNAIARKQFSDIKSSYEYNGLDLTALETTYTSFLSSLESASSTLTSITFNTLTISDLELNKDGNLELDVRANYDYTVSYTSWGSEEVQTHDDSDYSYITVVLGYDKGSYYLVNFDDLDTYFSRY